MTETTATRTPPPPGPQAPEPTSPVLQDWTPLTTCLDWQIGQIAFQRRGSQAFTTQEVPNLINQGGLSAYRAAEVLFSHCAELDAEGQLEPEILCMEMAIGLGLHALQLLDRFQALCTEQGKDWYDRLTFFATDGTPKMVVDARDHGVFERHPGRVVLGLVNALDPGRLTRLDDGETVDLTGRLRAVFHTYLLCVLPANIFRRVRRRLQDGEVLPVQGWTARAGDPGHGDDGTWLEQWSVIMARTVLRHPEALPRFAPLAVADVQAMAASEDPADKLPLVSLYPLLDLDLALATVQPDDLTEGPEVRRIADSVTGDIKANLRQHAEAQGEPYVDSQAEEVWVLHSAGALHSLQKTLEVLRKDGFALYRDYGPATAARANGNHLYQHYGATTAVGINHFALDAWFATPGDDGQPRAQVSVPPGEGEASIKNRLLSRAALPQTRQAFDARFDPKAFETLETLIAEARGRADQPRDSMEAYRVALQLERDNWMLLGEAGEAALRRARHPELAHMLLTEALRINPWYAGGTWNSLGDLYWSQGRIEDARQAYERAVQANPESFRGYLNLSDVCRRQGDHARAVEMAAMAIARDVDGTEAARSKAALDDAVAHLQAQRELAAKWRKERQAGSPK
jgi:tetratricopeptide (TPR) repeat protein